MLTAADEPQGMFSIAGEPPTVTAARQRILREFEDLEFYEEGHIYLLHGESLCSVSGIGHRFIREPFDEVAQSIRYAERNGMTAEYWLQQWKQNAFRATTLGTKTHEFGESLGYLKAGHPELIRPSIRAQYMEQYGYLAPIHPKEEAICQFMNDLPSSMHLYYYDGDGNPDKAGFVVLDYKTNACLYSEYNQRVRRTLLPPFDNYIEQDLSLYTIQLSLYALMLEDIGLPVIARRIVWLTNEGKYQMIPVPDVSEHLRAVL